MRRNIKLQLICYGVLMLSVALHKFGAVHFSHLQAAIGLAMLLLLLTTLVAAIGLIRAMAPGQSSALRKSGLSIALGFAPFLFVVLLTGLSAFSLPAIHDISTTNRSAMNYVAVLQHRSALDNRLITSNGQYPGLDELQREFYPNVQPLYLDVAPPKVLERARQLVEQNGWQLLRFDPQAGAIEAVAETAVMGFKDDLLILVSAVAGPGGASHSRVDVRSVSRVGVGDLGANAKRIETLLQQLQKG